MIRGFIKEHLDGYTIHTVDLGLILEHFLAYTLYSRYGRHKRTFQAYSSGTLNIEHFGGKYPGLIKEHFGHTDPRLIKEHCRRAGPGLIKEHS